MLDAMRQLALARLRSEIEGAGDPDTEAWYRQLRQHNLAALFPFLVEDVSDEEEGDKARYYTLAADPADDSIAVLKAHELTQAAASKLPFNKPSGSQSAALGPVIKRTAPSKAKPAGPSAKIQKTTLESFDEIAQANQPWSGFFRAAHCSWSRPSLNVNGQLIQAKVNAYQEAIDRINEKRTVLLAFVTADGRLPGEVPEYAAYLQETLALTKYATNANGPRQGRCALCAAEANVYPKAVFGAGLNIANLDRDGAFPGLDPCRAPDTFGVCVGCADLLYVYFRHVSADFESTVAGMRALIVPTLCPDPRLHAPFLRKVGAWVREARTGKGLKAVERQLLKQFVGEQQAVTTLDIVWANFGQVIDGVRGVITDVLPSRLQEIARVNDQIEEARSPLFPEERLDDFSYDVSLMIFDTLLKRPGGRAAQKSNESRRLWELRRELAEAIYHRREVPARLDLELLTTARWHWDQASRSEAPVYTLTQEGYSQKKKAAFLTVAGWVKQVARFRHYLQLVGVHMAETPSPYQPGVEWLKPYFGPESRMGKEEAFAFLLGALYGKLLTVQGKRGVNVNANALTWLRRLSLAGADLPELYNKVRGKLLEYGTERSRRIRELNEELADLGRQLCTSISLDETKTCYYLLLGQAMAVRLMPPKKKEGK